MTASAVHLDREQARHLVALIDAADAIIEAARAQLADDVENPKIGAALLDRLAATRARADATCLKRALR